MEGSENISANKHNTVCIDSGLPFNGEHPSTSLGLKTVSFDSQFDEDGHINNMIQGGDLRNDSSFVNDSQSHATTSFNLGKLSLLEDGNAQVDCVENFAKELALERKGIEGNGKKVKEEGGEHFGNSDTEDHLLEKEYKSDAIEKDPELFVTFGAEASPIVETRPGKESDVDNHLERNGEKEANTNVKNVEDKGMSKVLPQRDFEAVTGSKRKRGRKPKKATKPDFIEIQMVKHPLLPPCQCNKRKCHENFTLDMRSHIHDRFWIMNMYERKEWLSEHLLYLKPKSRTNHPVSTLHESHRKFFLPNQSEKIEVCRKMFFSTLGFKDEAKFLQKPKMLNKKGMLSRTRKRKCVMSRKHLSVVQEYCKDMAMQNGNTVNPGTTEDIIPSGFSLRDMYNDFCMKRSSTKFGYHRFRQIIELILRGDSIESYEFADLKEEEDEAIPEGSEESKTKPKCEKIEKQIKTSQEGEGPSPSKKKKHSRKKASTQKHVPKKNKTILKLPLFSNLKHTISKKRKRNEVVSSSAANKRYNFRASINVVTSYSEDHLMDAALDDSEMETFDDFVRDVRSVQDCKEKEENNYSEVVDFKPEIGKITIKKKTKNKRKANKYLETIKKARKPRKKKVKSATRLAQIAFAESRKKSGLNHPVLSPCNCNFRKCVEKISDKQRHVIHDEFWSFSTKEEKRKWIEKYVVHCKPRSRSTTIKFPRKHLSKKYFFPNEDGILVNVCRVFFMRTLGYHSNMTIDSMEMAELGLDIITISEDMSSDFTKESETFNGERAQGETSKGKDSDKKELDKVSHTPEIRTELSSETGNLEERVVCKEEVDNSQSFEEADGDIEDLETTEKKNMFFTPEVEKAEVEKAVNPNIKRRRPLSMRNSKEHHPMGLPCSCIKKCIDKIPETRREEIHEHYWSLITYNQRKQWILENITREVPKRRTVLNHPIRKKETRKCFLTNSEGNNVEVCRSFFLSTLGFKWDKMIDTICKTTPRGSKFVRADLRGKRPPIHKIPDDVTNCIRDYLESILKTIPFIPPQPKNSIKSGGKKPKKKKTSTAPAPNGLTIKTLFADYKAKHPHQKVSYATFRKVHIEVREIVRSQNPDCNDVEEENDSAPIENEDTHLPVDNMTASPGSDNGFSYVSNNVTFDSRRLNTNHANPSLGAIPSLQSCMYNEQPQLLNLSAHHHVPAKPNTINHNQPNRVGASHVAATTSNTSSAGAHKFSKAQHHQQQHQHHHPLPHHHQQDFHHILPFSASAKGPGAMYQIPGHSPSNLMAPYSSAQANPLDPFYMSSSPSQGISNPIAYPNLHFPADLIGHHPHLPPHPHHHHPAHHHPHLYQSHLPYHNRFSGNVLPQALKDHDPNNHNFYNPHMDFNQDHPDNNMFQFKDALNYPSFTPDNLSNTHSPVQNQIPNQIAFPGNSGSIIEQRNSNSSSQALPVSNFAEDMSMGSSAPGATVTSNIKASSMKDHLEFINEGSSHDIDPSSKGSTNESSKEKKKRPRNRKKKDDTTPKVPRVRKVRPLSNRNSKEHHPMLPPCTCGKKCSEKISQEQREVIYDAFWDLGNYSNRKQWIADHMKREDPKRRTNLEATVMRKKETRRFTLPTSADDQVEVCRLFFLHTLGMKWDKIIGTICKTTARDEHVTPPDMRGRKTPAHKLNEEVLQSVESYAKALIQAAKPEYLANLQQPKKGFSLDTFIPYGLNMKNLHQDYKAKHASHKISYESFRKIFRQIRREVLDPDSVTEEQKAEIQNITEPAEEYESVEGTINATTGHIDTVETSSE